jgi:hypothetical protein
LFINAQLNKIYYADVDFKYNSQIVRILSEDNKTIFYKYGDDKKIFNINTFIEPTIIDNQLNFENFFKYFKLITFI